MENSNNPFHLLQIGTPKKTGPQKLREQIASEESNPKRSFLNVMKQAKEQYLSPETQKPDLEPEDEMKLEDIFSQKKPESLPWPPVRHWGMELIQNPRLILNCFIGGVIVALITVPQSMAYCAMVNFPVKYGLNSCTIALVIYSIFSSSKQISIGPLASTYFIMAQAIDGLEYPEEERANLARTMTFLIGVALIFMGCTSMSFIENVFSEPVIMGFLQSTSFLIVYEQIGIICQIKLKGHIWQKFYQLFWHLDQANPVSALMGGLTIIIFFIIHMIKKKYFPKSLFLMCMPFIIPASSALISYLCDFPKLYNIETAQNIPSGFPPFEIPPLSYHYLWATWADALKVGIVSFTTSMLIAKQLAKKYNYEINVTYEFIAFGFANFIGSFFTSLPAFGSLARTPIIEFTGAKSQLTGFITGIVVIIEFMCLTGFLEQMPITVISGFVFYSCSLIFTDLKETVFWAKHFKQDFVFFTITFVFCIVLGSANGLILAIMLSLLYILRSSSKPIWSFKAFESDEERIQNNENRLVKRNTMLLWNYLNENDSPEIDVNASWLVNLKRLTSLSIEMNSEGLREENSKDLIARDIHNLTADDICLCHNWNCERICHIVVISLHGNLSYVNIKGLKEQTEFMTIDVECNNVIKGSTKKSLVKSTNNDVQDEKDEVLVQNPLNYEMQMNPKAENLEEENPEDAFSAEKRKLSIRAIIFECSKLNEVDYTSLNALKSMAIDFNSRKKKVWVKFSEMNEKLRKKFSLFAFPKSSLEMSSKNTMAVLYKCCADILKPTQ